MPEVGDIEQTEISKESLNFSPKEEKEIKAEAAKMLKIWRHWKPEKVAGFLATQAPRSSDRVDLTRVLIEILNNIKNMPVEKKKEMIDESCKSNNSWVGYTRGNYPGDKGEQKKPEEYYKLLREEKAKLADKNKIPARFSRPPARLKLKKVA